MDLHDYFVNSAGLLMGDDIGSDLSSMAVCFVFHSTNVLSGAK